MRKVLIVAPLAALALSACSTETISSSDIKTHGIYAAMDVTATSQAFVDVRVELKSGGDDSNVYVTLDNGDKLIGTGGTETKNLLVHSQGVYKANFSQGAANTEYKIDFQRPDDTSAPNSTGTLPGPFEIDALPTNTPSRASDDLEIKWTPEAASHEVRIEIDGDCIFSWEKRNITADPGAYTVPKGALQSTGGSNPTTCELHVRVIKIRSGSLDPAFGGGYVHLAQIRDAKFNSAP
jgi:hypothetical protein